MAKTLQQLLVVNTVGVAGSSSIKDPETIDIIPQSPQELYEITRLVSELLPGLPGDGVFAVDAVLCSPATIFKDPVVWQCTYGYNDCRMLEGAFLAGKGEISLASARPGNKQFTVNLTSRHEIREETGTARPVQRILTFQLTKATSDAVDGEAGDKEETRRKLAADLLGQCRPGREASRPAGHAQDGRDHRG